MRGTPALIIALAATLLASLGIHVAARPGFTVEVIEEKIGERNEGWCELDKLKSGWFKTSFDLTGCKHVNGTGGHVSDEDAAALAASMASPNAVSVLTLSSTGLSSLGARALVRQVSNHGALVGLILDNNHIDSSAAPDLSELLRVSTKLAVLDLSNNELGVEGILDVLLALEENKALVVLSLQGNDMKTEPAVPRPGNEGGIARGFSGLLHERTALRILRVGATGISLQGVSLIMSALETNDHVEEFEIGFQNIKHAGAEMIAEALQKNKVLRRLTIDGSGIEDDGASEIAHALVSNTALRELSIESNGLTGKAAKYFATALEKGADGLIELDLGYRGHGMSPEWYHYIGLLLRCNAAGHRKELNAGDCKEAIMEAEEVRVCKVLTANNLPCGAFFANKITTMSDLIMVTAARCAELEGAGLPHGLQDACVRAQQMALAQERPFDGHAEL